MLPISQTSPVSSHRSLIPINIETLAGSSFELLVSPYEQIQYIKRKIERREGIPVSHQHLIWKSNELEDESCLHDYKIEAGTTLKLVLAMRGGPVNTKRVPIEDNFIREMSEYIENSRDDYTLTSDLLPSSSSSNKNVTFLVLRDGDQFNFFQVIDRGDGTLSPLSGSMSNTSLYNAHETLTVEQEREYDEKRQADDRKTKQKMELIRSKLKTHTRKDAFPVRPSSTTKQTKTNLIHHHRRNILVDSSSNLSTHGNNSSGTSSLEQQKQSCSVPYQLSSTNLFNTYNILAAAAIGQSIYLHEEDSEDEEDSHDEDDNQQQKILSSSPMILANQKKQQLLTSRSYSPSGFNQKKHHRYEQESSKKTLHDSYYQSHKTKNRIRKHDSTDNTMFSTNYPSTTTVGPVSQETAIATTTTTSENDTNTGAILVDNINPVLPTLDQQSIPIDSTSSHILSTTMSKQFNMSDELKSNNIDSILDNQDEKIISNSEIIYQQSHTSPMLELLDDDIISPTNDLTSTTSIHDDKTEPYRKRTADIQSRNDTSLSKPIWTDDDDQLIIGDEYTVGERTSTSQSILFRHRNSSTSTTIATPVPTFPNVVKKSTLPSTTQQFYHYHKTLNNDTKQTKSSPRPLIPLTLSKYRRMPSNIHVSTASLHQQTYTSTSNTPSNDLINNGNGNDNNSTDSYNEHLIHNKRIEVLKTPGKKQSTQSSFSSSSLSSCTTIFSAASTSTKRHFQQQDIKSVGATATVPPPSSSSLIPLDNTKVTIETIGSKTVSALLRQNATIEPVDTSRGVGKHLVSLLTTASKETTSIKTGYKASSRDTVFEERYKLDPKLNNLWSSTTSNNLSTVSSSLQSSKLPPVIVNRKSTSKCFLCKKKTGLATTYQCKCGSSFCSEHRYPEAHACAFDYKAEGKRLIERNNPLVTAPKLPKI
ncbi:unnamed protein product [Rotaria sordida]|uniref:AN1-type zinc finger protein 4 n=1 Tax=Rotaria sordida TaxID=392033 RepID=A0A818JFG1_9BILA|nr:unnamed protein product [Rotaria sordida]